MLMYNNVYSENCFPLPFRKQAYYKARTKFVGKKIALVEEQQNNKKFSCRHVLSKLSRIIEWRTEAQQQQ